jgi:hypothetical protein
MTTTRRTLLILLIAAVLAPFAPSFGAEPPVHVAGVAFERHALVAGTELVLNGTGVRAVAWFKGYAAALYLPALADTAAQVVALPGPKRLQLRMLRDVPAVEFVNAFNKGVARNATPEERPLLAARMERFAALVAAVEKVREGDVIDLDLDAAHALRFNLNGKPRGEPIVGEDFYAALLRAFIGELPYDGKLKAGLLGGGGNSR